MLIPIFVSSALPPHYLLVYLEVHCVPSSPISRNLHFSYIRPVQVSIGLFAAMFISRWKVRLRVRSLERCLCNGYRLVEVQFPSLRVWSILCESIGPLLQWLSGLSSRLSMMPRAFSRLASSILASCETTIDDGRMARSEIFSPASSTGPPSAPL